MFSQFDSNREGAEGFCHTNTRKGIAASEAVPDCKFSFKSPELEEFNSIDKKPIRKAEPVQTSAAYERPTDKPVVGRGRLTAKRIPGSSRFMLISNETVRSHFGAPHPIVYPPTQEQDDTDGLMLPSSALRRY